MTTLPLSCGSYDLVIDASASSVTINSLNPITLSGALKFSSLSSGFASLDSSGNVSSVAGSLFSTSTNYTLTGTWTYSSAVQVNSTLGVTGAVTLGGAVLHTGIATIASSIGIPSIAPPAGWGYAIINTTTGEIRRMT